MEANKINTKTQNKTFGFYAKNAGLLILKFFLYVLYSAVVTLPVFLTTVSCTTLFFLAVATFVCVITIVPMFLVPIAFFAFLINAPVACLITCGTILGAVVLAAIIIQIVAMCLANSEYGKEVSMKANQKLNSWEVNIYIWKDIYSVYDKISAIGEQKKTNEKPNLNGTVNINMNENKSNINQQPQKDVTENGCKIKNSQDGESTEVPEQKINQANEKKSL